MGRGRGLKLTVTALRCFDTCLTTDAEAGDTRQTFTSTSVTFLHALLSQDRPLVLRFFYFANLMFKFGPCTAGRTLYFDSHFSCDSS